MFLLQLSKTIMFLFAPLKRMKKFSSVFFKICELSVGWMLRQLDPRGMNCHVWDTMCRFIGYGFQAAKSVIGGIEIGEQLLEREGFGKFSLV